MVKSLLISISKYIVKALLISVLFNILVMLIENIYLIKIFIIKIF